MQRLDDATIYNPFGWRLAELAAGSGDDERRRRLLDELIVWEAHEVAHGYRHVTVEHGEPSSVEESRRLSAFYIQLDGLVEDAAWHRVRGTADYVTVTVAGHRAEALIARITAAARSMSAGWTVAATAVPSASASVEL